MMNICYVFFFRTSELGKVSPLLIRDEFLAVDLLGSQRAVVVSLGTWGPGGAQMLETS